MNPDKLFDYLEGSLPEWERTQLEKQLSSDPQLQRELSVAREIHARTNGGRGEVLLESGDVTAAHGRKMAFWVGSAFLILVFLNVGFGLFIIGRHEASNPNRQLLENQMREQISKSLQQASTALTPPPLDVNDITLPVGPGRMGEVADAVVATAQRLGGSATKELPDAHQTGVLVDIPSDREAEFRSALATIGGGPAAATPPNPGATPGAQKKSFVVKIVEPASP